MANDHRPTYQFITNSGDVTAWAKAFQYQHGLNTKNDNYWNFSHSRGELRLENTDGYWTEQKLEALTTLRVLVDSVEICDCDISNYVNDQSNRLVRLLLQGKQYAEYERELEIDLTANTSIPDLLSAANLTITPKTPWSNYMAGKGLVYRRNVSKFIEDLQLLADCMIVEDHEGNFVAIVPTTDTRQSSLTISPVNYYILRERADKQNKRRWRRGSQEINIQFLGTNQATLKVNNNANILSLRGMTVAKSGDGSNRQADFTFDLFEFAGLEADDPKRDLFKTYTASLSRMEIEVKETIGGTEVDEDDFLRMGGPRTKRPGISNHIMQDTSRIKSGANATEQLAYENDQAWRSKDDLTFTLTFDDDAYSDNFTNVVANAAYPQLKRSGLSSVATNQALVTAKLQRLSGQVPVVSEFLLPLNQASSSDLGDILGMRIGDVVGVNVSALGFEVVNTSHVVAVAWRLLPNQPSTIRLTLLSKGSLERSPVKYKGQQVKYKSQNVKYL